MARKPLPEHISSAQKVLEDAGLTEVSVVSRLFGPRLRIPLTRSNEIRLTEIRTQHDESAPSEWPYRKGLQAAARALRLQISAKGVIPQNRMVEVALAEKKGGVYAALHVKFPWL